MRNVLATPGSQVLRCANFYFPHLTPKMRIFYDGWVLVWLLTKTQTLTAKLEALASLTLVGKNMTN